ncbi:MAG: transporter substrate-binding domain-containing protein, partial [Acidimicrobiaceae bacterium]
MQKHLLLRLLAVLLGFTLVASACGDDDSDSGEAADSSSDSSDDSSDGSSEDSSDDSEDVVEATQDGSVLAAVIARGELNCGVSGAGVGFSVTQPDGSQVGFDADYCRATAAAILGDANAVNFVPLTAAERFTAVQTGQVDVLFRNT